MEDMDVVDNDVDDMPPHPPVLRRQSAYDGRPAFEEVLRYIQEGGNIPSNDIIIQGWPGVLFTINQGIYNFDNDQIYRQNNIANIYNNLPHYNFKSKKSVKKTKKSVKKAKKSVKKAKKSVKKAKKSVKKAKKSVKKAKKSVKKTKK